MIAYITINIDPVVHLGPLAVHWYGLIMTLALIVGAVIFTRNVTRRGIADEGHVMGMLLFVVPLAVIGARLFHVLDDFSFYWHHPAQIVSLPLIGFAIYGVLAGGLSGIALYCRWKRLPTLKVLDALALAIPVGQIIGRCANIINGDTWGPATKLPWGFIYTNPNALIPGNLLGVPTHPTPVYEQIWLVIMVIILWRVVPRLKTDGMALVAYLALYSAGRFVISFWRVNNVLFSVLREAQLVALGLLIALIPCAWWLRRRAARQGVGKNQPSASRGG